MIGPELSTFLGRSGRLIVVYHWDADGICSAALVGSRVRPDGCVPCGNELDEAVAEEALSSDPDRVLVLDVGGLAPGPLANLACSADVMVVDHHHRSEPPEGVAFLRCDEPVSLALHRALGGPDWIAAVGTRGDKDEDYCRSAFPSADLRSSRVVMGMLNAGKNLKGREGARLALDALLEARSLADLAEGRTGGARTLKGFDGEIERETRHLIAGYERTARRHTAERLVFYDIRSPLNLSSRVSSILRWKAEGWIVFVCNSEIEPVPISVRTTRRDINLVELLAGAGLTSCGGHPDACGGTVPASGLEPAVSRLVSLLAGR